MKNFHFKLQPVLEERERQEKKAAARLTSARNDALAAQDVHRSVAFACSEGREEAARLTRDSDACAVGELKFFSVVLEQLDRHSQETAIVARGAEAAVTASSLQYDHAVRERSMLDRLEERHREVWRQSVLSGDRHAMDALALARHVLNSREHS